MKIALLLGMLAVAACSAVAPTVGPTSPPATFPATSSPSPVPTASTALVGKWQLDRTCAALLRAVTEAGHPEFLSFVLEELITGNADPADPCANAKPPTNHSHTFWPDGRFNSYDENEGEVDSGRWMLVDDDTMRIGEPSPMAEFDFAIQRNSLTLTPVIPADCTGDCLEMAAYEFAVAFPGETWTRETSGPHVP